MAELELPWRGPGPERPVVPLPPDRMPLRQAGQLRKRWRYVGVFAEELMLCAAWAQVGPLTQSFWILWDREERRQRTHTARRPRSREVRLEGARLEIEATDLRASLLLGDAAAVESICPSGRSWAWTRKRAGLPVEGTIDVAGNRRRLNGHGIDDESAGYHARHTAWRWSAGVGRSAEGAALAWNLVEGVNDPPRHSERAIWIDGVPQEPPPAAFAGSAVELGSAGRLGFAAESAHARDDRYPLLRSRYRHSFGSFSGTLAGHRLAEGLGVMEEHDALW